MRPTARGLGTVSAGAVLIGAGFTFGYPELAVLGAAALVAAVCAVAYAMLRPRLSVRRTAEPDRVSRGEACELTLTVTNISRLRSATLIAQDTCGRARAGRGTVPVPLLRLRRGRDTVVSYPVPTDRRGVVVLGPLSVTRRDPLGLAGLARTYGGTAKVWVYPRSHPIAAVPVGIARSLDGRVDKVPHGSITFDTLREYVIGDELRHVHWRTTARVGELMVREHLDTSLPRIVVLLDDRAAAYPDGEEPFEAACEAAASVVLAAVREELPVELVPLARDTVPTRSRRPDPRPMLDRLAEAELVPEDPAGALRGATRRLRQYRLGDTLIYLTGTGRADDLPLVGALRAQYPVIVAGVFGDPDQAPSTVDGLTVLAVPDAAEFAAAWDGVGRW